MIGVEDKARQVDVRCPSGPSTPRGSAIAFPAGAATGLADRKYKTLPAASPARSPPREGADTEERYGSVIRRAQESH